MPGINQTQDQLISYQNLQTALAQLAQSTALVQQKQTELLVELNQKFRKAPTIIKSGSIYDVTRIYLIPADGGNAYSMYKNFLSSSVTFPRGQVGVLPLLDADEIEINVLSFPPASATIAPPYLAYALTPNDLNTNIPTTQFSLLPKYDFISAGFPTSAAITGTNTEFGSIDNTTDPPNGIYTGNDSINEEIAYSGATGASMIVQSGRIQCSGNQYLHFFGFLNGNPYFVNGAFTISPAIWTYKLIK